MRGWNDATELVVGMTEQRLRELVTVWQQRLGLDKWDIHVEIRQADDDCSAMTQRSENYDTATIVFQPWMAGQAPAPTDWPGRPWDETEVEKTVVHELLHCCLRDLKYAAVEPLDGHLHRDVDKIFQHGVSSAEEKVVARLSEALVNAWPTPARLEAAA